MENIFKEEDISFHTKKAVAEDIPRILQQILAKQIMYTTPSLFGDVLLIPLGKFFFGAGAQPEELMGQAHCSLPISQSNNMICKVSNVVSRK